MRQAVLALTSLLLAACGEGGLSRFDGEAIPPPPPEAGPNEKIKIVGSSTVAPFATAVAEQFGAATRFSTPVVESNGTGAGIRDFCRGLGAGYPSIANASRPITAREMRACARTGVTEIVEAPFGYDGIVIAGSRDGPDFDLTKAQLFLAVAASTPDGEGGWTRNRRKRWSDIDPELPDTPILLAGPPLTSGTRDAFIELALAPGAASIPQAAALQEADPDAFETLVRTFRKDGAWIDAGENDATIIQMLIKDEHALGVLGFSFLDQNLDRVKAAKIGGVRPTFKTIASGEYALSRVLFFYVKRQNVAFVPGILTYVEAFTDDSAIGETGFLVEKGLIPLPEAARRSVREAARALQPMPQAPRDDP